MKNVMEDLTCVYRYSFSTGQIFMAEIASVFYNPKSDVTIVSFDFVSGGVFSFQYKGEQALKVEEGDKLDVVVTDPKTMSAVPCCLEHFFKGEPKIVKAEVAISNYETLVLYIEELKRHVEVVPFIAATDVYHLNKKGDRYTLEVYPQVLGNVFINKIWSFED